MIAQERALVGFLSARENVELGLALRGLPAGNGTARALDALALVGLSERAEHAADRLRR